MKRFLSVLITLSLLSTMTAVSFAAETNPSNHSINSINFNCINSDNITFTQEEIAEQIAINNRLREEAIQMDTQISTNGIADRVIYTAPVTQHQQINNYYCGPASTQMVYEGITGDTSHDQEWFADELGTSKAGTSSDQIAATLKDLTGKNYSVTNVLKSNQDQTDLYNNISNSLKKGFAVVVNVKEVPGRYTSTSGHFMVVYQSFIDLAYGIGTVYYTYNDPHYNDDYYGTYPISSYDLLKAISSNSGNYVRVS